MSNDYKKMKSLANRMCQDAERLERTLNPPHIKQMQELDRMLNSPWLKQIQELEDFRNPPHLKHLRELEEMRNPPYLRQWKEMECALKRHVELTQLENNSFLKGYASQFEQTSLAADSHCQSLGSVDIQFTIS